MPGIGQRRAHPGHVAERVAPDASAHLLLGGLLRRKYRLPGGGDEALRLLISGTPGQRNRCLRRLHGMDTEQADEQDSRGLSPFRAGAPDPRRLSGDVDQERAGQDQRPVLHPAEPIVLTVAKCEASRDYLGYVNSCPGPHAWYLNCTGEDC